MCPSLGCYRAELASTAQHVLVQSLVLSLQLACDLGVHKCNMHCCTHTKNVTHSTTPHVDTKPFNSLASFNHCCIPHRKLSSNATTFVSLFSILINLVCIARVKFGFKSNRHVQSFFPRKSSWRLCAAFLCSLSFHRSRVASEELFCFYDLNCLCSGPIWLWIIWWC